MTVLIYVDPSKQVGDPEHLKVSVNVDAAEAWFAENDPEGLALRASMVPGLSSNGTIDHQGKDMLSAISSCKSIQFSALSVHDAG